MRRIGPKASGKWERITWDEALDTIAERILDYKERFGAESIVPGYGTGRDNESVIYRFANLLGTPNVLTAGHFCYGPRIATSILTCGTNPIVDYENHPKCIMVWGNNLTVSNPDCYKGEPFSVSLDKGAKLIAVDPRFTKIAARADIWLRLRPGTDAALALGMLNVIVNEGLYDREFVENYVHCRSISPGNPLKQRVQQRTLLTQRRDMVRVGILVVHHGKFPTVEFRGTTLLHIGFQERVLAVFHIFYGRVPYFLRRLGF
jgi:anaerobic selenocysteine-containing dehydrogenase